jgi:hypothetical protein
MITTSACEGFDYLLKQGIKNHLVNQESDSYEILAVDDVASAYEPHLVVLTISSYLFRLMVFIHFTADEPTRVHLAKLSKISANDMNERVFMDAICERANMFCGAMSRDLVLSFPHVGMSTPNVVDRRCASHLHLLNPAYVRHFKVDVNDTASFRVTLCVNDYDKLDFRVDKMAAEVDGGELEMF